MYWHMGRSQFLRMAVSDACWAGTQRQAHLQVQVARIFCLKEASLLAVGNVPQSISSQNYCRGQEELNLYIHMP
jgi:hypothetical protein